MPIPASIIDIVPPLSIDDFVNSYWGKRAVHFPGCKHRFGALLSWSTLNRALDEHRLKPPRVYLIRGGIAVDAAKYLCFDPTIKDLRLLPKAVRTELENGATLVLNNVDEFCSPLRRLIESLEEFFGFPVHANAYLSQGSDNGFRLHWDEQDTLILQIFGRKDWEIYRPTADYPIRGEDSGNITPVELPEWKGVLNDGCALYMPRGWWHRACPINEMTLHVTITLLRPTGVQLISWLLDRLKYHPAMRLPIPNFASQEKQREYMADLAAVVHDSLPLLSLDEFRKASGRSAVPRPHFDLRSGRRAIQLRRSMEISQAPEMISGGSVRHRETGRNIEGQR